MLLRALVGIKLEWTLHLATCLMAITCVLMGFLSGNCMALLRPGCVSPWLAKELAELVDLPPGKIILHRYILYSWIKNLSCGTDKLLLLCCRGWYPNYYLGRTSYYNYFLFMWWNYCFSETFKHFLPCLTGSLAHPLETWINWCSSSLPGQSCREVTQLLMTW